MRQSAVKHPNSNATVGWVAWDENRGETVYASVRSKNTSMYRNTPPDKSGGYNISESILAEIRSYGCKRVYIAEEETGDVYQFSLHDYLNGMRVSHNPDDTQRCMSVDDRAVKYTDYMDDLFIEEGER